MRFLLLFWISVNYCSGADFSVDDMERLKSVLSIVGPGDTLELREGVWDNVNIVFSGTGTLDAPITLKAKTPGRTVFTGNSTLRISGRYLTVEGLSFTDPNAATSDVIQFRGDSENLAKNCRITNCAIVNFSNKAQHKNEGRWVGLYGSNNRVDHCTFIGKAEKGTTLVVWLDGDHPGRHEIDHNFFGQRKALGSNGGETIRIGDSKTSMLDGNCIIEKNMFFQCNGETECISNKSCGNIYRDNMFTEVSGTLTLRHGNRCIVENNIFIGNHAKGTGGIRVIGEDHIVRGNYLEGLSGDDARAAICLMTGIPNSPANRYFQVQRALIENNTIVDCKHPILIGLSDSENATLPPIDSSFVGNKVSCPKFTIIEARCSLEGISWKDNHFMGKSLGIPNDLGITKLTVRLEAPKPLARDRVGTTWRSEPDSP